MKSYSRYFIVYLLLGLVGLFIYTHETIAVPVSRPLTDIPQHVEGWTMVGQSRFSPDVLAILKPTDYLYRVYRDDDGNKVTLFLGYFDGGPGTGGIHSPKHCLPGSGWFEVSVGKRMIHAAGKELPLVQSLYQFHDQKELFMYFFQVKGRILDNEYSLKIAEIVNSILYKRKDTAFIRISVPYVDDNLDAAKVGERFLTAIYPHIAEVLPL